MSRHAAKVVSVNALVLLALVGTVLLTPPLLHSALNVYRDHIQTLWNPKVTDSRMLLPLYSNYDWTHDYFREHHETSFAYRDYEVWRRNDFSGKTIEIRNGVRQSSNPTPSDRSEHQVLFFGGSTTWGSGVSTEHTYPSKFAQLSGHRVTNFGEGAFIARQSLARLVNFYINGTAGRSRTIVFYDGVNEVNGRCRNEAHELSTNRQGQVANALSRLKAQSDLSIVATFSQWNAIVSSIKTKIARSKPGDVAQTYRCHRDQIRAEEIARSVVDQWVMAQKLARASGDKFLAVLQPAAFVGQPSLDHLPDLDQQNPGLRQQFAIVYPLIRKEAMRHRELNFVDLSSALDSSSDVYIDFSHLAPRGNELVAAAILKAMKGRDLL